MNPIKPNFKTEIITIITLIIVMSAAFFFYANFPDRIAIHWNIEGQVDNWTENKLLGAFGIPTLMCGVYLMMIFLPYLDPKKNRYQEFAKTYHIFKTLILAVLALVYLASGAYNIGYAIDVTLVSTIAIGLLFIVMGNYMGKIKYNWFIGIRTPWTLSSEKVWNKTHRFSGWLFIILGIVIIATPYLPSGIKSYTFGAAIILTVLGSFIYSYWLYYQEKSKAKI